MKINKLIKYVLFKALGNVQLAHSLKANDVFFPLTTFNMEKNADQKSSFHRRYSIELYF